MNSIEIVEITNEMIKNHEILNLLVNNTYEDNEIINTYTNDEYFIELLNNENCLKKIIKYNGKNVGYIQGEIQTIKFLVSREKHNIKIMNIEAFHIIKNEANIIIIDFMLKYINSIGRLNDVKQIEINTSFTEREIQDCFIENGFDAVSQRRIKRISN